MTVAESADAASFWGEETKSGAISFIQRPKGGIVPVHPAETFNFFHAFSLNYKISIRVLPVIYGMSTENPHDRFAKSVMSKIENAKDFFHAVLPEYFSDIVSRVIFRFRSGWISYAAAVVLVVLFFLIVILPYMSILNLFPSCTPKNGFSDNLCLPPE